MYKDQKLQFEKKISSASIVILLFIVSAYILGALTPLSYPVLSGLNIPSYFSLAIGLIVTTVVSKTGIKEVVDNLIYQEIKEGIDEGIKKQIQINQNQIEDIDFTPIDLSENQKTIFGNLGLEYISILFKAFSSSWQETESFRLSSKTWGKHLIAITPEAINVFETNSRASNEAVQLLIRANEFRGKSSITILQFISKKSVQSKYNGKINKSLNSEYELYKFVLAALSAWLICSIKYQVKIPSEEIQGKYNGDPKDSIAALEYIKETALKEFMYSSRLYTASIEAQKVISEYLGYLIKDVKLH
jgi:hypothetical protein